MLENWNYHHKHFKYNFLGNYLIDASLNILNSNFLHFSITFYTNSPLKILLWISNLIFILLNSQSYSHIFISNFLIYFLNHYLRFLIQISNYYIVLFNLRLFYQNLNWYVKELTFLIINHPFLNLNLIFHFLFFIFLIIIKVILLIILNLKHHHFFNFYQFLSEINQKLILIDFIHFNWIYSYFWFLTIFC